MVQMPSFRAHVLDCDFASRKTIGSILSRVGIGVTPSGDISSFWGSYEPGQAACIICELVLPGHTGLDLLADLRRRGDLTPLLIVTADPSVRSAVQALRLGAFDYLAKPVDPHELVHATQAAIRADVEIRATGSKTDQFLRELRKLSGRELEVLEQVAQGLSSKRIAATLGISPKTAENYRARLAEKLGVASVAHLVRLALAARIGAQCHAGETSSSGGNGNGSVLVSLRNSCQATRPCPALKAIVGADEPAADATPIIARRCIRQNSA